MYQVAKSRIAANSVEVGVSPYELQHVRLVLIGPYERGNDLFVPAQTQVRIYECSRGNVTSTLASLQIREKPECVRAAAGKRIGADQHTRNRRAALGDREGSLEDSDSLARLMIGVERKSKRQQSPCVARLHRERAPRFTNGFVVTMGLKQYPRNTVARHRDGIQLP